ncbi:M23/M37 family peptidase [Isoalcanivorax pacificus W11-5]|uniref:M23/M37 family peptidase n=1 Tax=Isoalcanivorax pacificus W11-5 TaxID=391936 RepID=A0A0B4XLG4_9GAMM|nr:M23 family metallopeptidase [Isoalcanivorax pacificus]AJD47393.1 M23/M37 family peptidase [Isoalcanivorax pacificus W11-5]
MNIIVLNSRGHQSRALRLPRHLPGLLLAVLFVIPAMVGVGAYYAMYHWGDPVLDQRMTARWQDELASQRGALDELNRRTDEELRALTIRLADMQARLMRIDALGERLVDIAGIPSDEFDFSAPAAVGGPELPEERSLAYTAPSFTQALTDLAVTLDRREEQLSILERLMDNRRIAEKAELSGRPIVRGWLSSRFGQRTDPFSGRLTMHRGVDFAAKDGSDVVATGAGVVTFAGQRWGYGNLVEVNHGNGVATRYAHMKEVLVSAGDIVRAGDVIAVVGSTGRSTGPHVHYEVLRNGRQVDPTPYIVRARR